MCPPRKALSFLFSHELKIGMMHTFVINFGSRLQLRCHCAVWTRSNDSEERAVCTLRVAVQPQGVHPIKFHIHNIHGHDKVKRHTLTFNYIRGA